MKNVLKLSILSWLVLSVSFGAQDAMAAGKYPEKPITIICHASAGGGADLFARTVASAVNTNNLLPQQLVVENKPGASGGIAYAYVAGKKKDPYYLLTTVSSFLTTPLMGTTPVTYKDFTPVVNLIADRLAIMVSAKSKHQSMKDIIVYSKKNPKGVTIGGTQLGSIDSIMTHMFEKAVGVQLNYVVFDGAPEINTAILGGHVDISMCNPCEVLDLAKAGKVKILGIFADERMAEAPDVPTMKEQGIDLVSRTFRGLSAPGDIPEEARKVLEEAFSKSLKTEVFKKYLKDNMISERYMNGATFGKFLEEESSKFAMVLKEMNLYKKK